jgi:hypothetical protein
MVASLSPAQLKLTWLKTWILLSLVWYQAFVPTSDLQPGRTKQQTSSYFLALPSLPNFLHFGDRQTRSVAERSTRHVALAQQEQMALKCHFL